MKLTRLLLAASALFAVHTAPLFASADGGGYADWQLASPALDGVNSAIVSPGNDTRVNMLLLLRDAKGTDNTSFSYPNRENYDAQFGRNYFSWYDAGALFYPSANDEQPEGEAREVDRFGGSRCQTYDSGTRAMSAAMSKAEGLAAEDRTAILAARETLLAICETVDTLNGYYPRDEKPEVDLSLANIDLSPSSAAGKEYLEYLKGAAAFYSGQFGKAADAFAGLSNAKDAWVKETALYMLARNALNEAQAGAFSDWGSYDEEKSDTAIAAKAKTAFDAYLKQYPNGQYATSARGLVRRALWAAKDWQPLAAEFSALLTSTNPASPELQKLIEEVDIKLMLAQGFDPKTLQDPLLLAISDLERMRAATWYRDEETPPITRAEIDAQAPLFKDRKALFTFVQANHAYYVERNAKAVLALIPDAAKQGNFSYLEFSRQALRGMALAALKDRNEVGFWQEMMGGAKAVYQRPMVELGLAIALEQSGRMEEIFARDSMVKDGYIRRQLLGQVAGPDRLKRQASDPNVGKSERALALFTLLHKSLSRGRYSEFVENVNLAQKKLPEDFYGLWSVMESEEAPTAVFVDGKLSDGYPCAPLAKSVAALANNPKDIRAKLCLGDFWRLNDFDRFSELDGGAAWQYQSPDDEKDKPLPSPSLGSSKEQFPGTKIRRHDFYTDIIATPNAAANDRAYALYRAVYCYAPGGNNTCGGEGVEKEQRKAWFSQLKREYPNSEWAKKLRYYW